MNEIIDIYYTHKKRYGYRRIALELVHRGFKVNHKKVKRLMTYKSQDKIPQFVALKIPHFF